MLFVAMPLIIIVGVIIFEYFSEASHSTIEAKTEKNMTREDRLKICKRCTHCTQDRRGIVCGKTNEYADFDGQCKEFYPSEQYMEQKDLQGKKRTLSVDDNNFTALLSIIIGVAWIFFMIIGMWDDVSDIITDIVIPLSVMIALSAIVVGIVLLFVRWMRRKKIEAEVLKSHSLTKEKIMDIIRFEGYYPRLDDDGEIVFKIEGDTYGVDYDGAKLQLSYRFAISPSEHEVTAAQIKGLAASVSDGIIMAEIDVIELPDDDGLGVIISLCTFCYYEEELRKTFSIYLNIVREALTRFGRGFELLTKEPPRRNEIYQPEYRWLPDVVFKAVSQGQLAPEALTDEEWLRENIKNKISSSEMSDEWNSFKINRIDNYGDYKLIVYQFPEPKVVPEAKYGAVLMNTTTLDIDYYTLEKTFNDKWVYGSMTSEQHRNYGEVDTDDLGKFIEWIFTKDKQAVSGVDYTKEEQKTIN